MGRTYKKVKFVVEQDGEMEIIRLEYDQHKVKRGHQPHLSGAGKHQDRRLRRNKTRENEVKRAIEEND
jgi:hypothetical protein